jgi:acetate kinase
MGLTPLEGVLMGTRCGDIDPGVIFYLMREGQMEPSQVERMLNNQSGLLGLSGISNDQRPIQQAVSVNPRARLALQVFAYRIRKYIGAYMAVIGVPHALLFTGGVGENSANSRRDICGGLEHFGIKLDEAANAVCKGEEACISAADARVKIWVIPTNEELMIARDTAALASGRAPE